MEESRKQFEESFEEITGWEADDYPNADCVQQCWEFWQASRSAVEVKLNKAEVELEELESAHMCLDDAGVPRKEGNETLSLWGRIVRCNAAGLRVKEK